MKRFRVRFFAAVLALAVAGCVNIDYVGQEFAPTPESEPIAYFRRTVTGSSDGQH